MNELPFGWKSYLLGEVCQFQRGLTYKKKDEVAKSKNAVLRANNISLENGELNFHEIRYIDEAIEIPKSKIVKKDSLLICTASGSKKHLGKVAFIDKRYPYAFGGFMGMITPSNIIEPKYLYWLTRSKTYFDFIEGLSDGANINNLKFSQLSEFKIPVPLLTEQKRIVAILDEAFSGIEKVVANTEKNLTNVRELFESYLDNIFTFAPNHWIAVELNQICTIKHGFAFKSKFFAPNGDYIVLTPGSFWEKGGFRDQGKKTKYYMGEIPDGYILEKGDFLVAMTEQAVGLLGSSLIVPEADRYLHNQRLGLIQVRDGVEWHNDFFLHQFNTQAFRDAVEATASGVKVRHTSPTKLGAIKIKFPPTKAEQIRIANKLNELLDETRKLEQIYQQKLTALTELKQSLLQKVFSGELTAEPQALLKEAAA